MSPSVAVRTPLLSASDRAAARIAARRCAFCASVRARRNPFGWDGCTASRLTGRREIDADAKSIRTPSCYVVGCRQEESPPARRSLSVVGGARPVPTCACTPADLGTFAWVEQMTIYIHPFELLGYSNVSPWGPSRVTSDAHRPLAVVLRSPAAICRSSPGRCGGESMIGRSAAGRPGASRGPPGGGLIGIGGCAYY